MIGAIADFGRYAWGLLYWNSRKSVFRLTHGRNPCQSPSDSGRALETGCDACTHWHKPARFRRVCPLLTRTDGGWKCSAQAADVRPFWGLALRFYGLSLLCLYLALAVGLFGYLRLVGYPVSLLQITWPGLWYRVPQAQSAFFQNEANAAFGRGRIREGLLELANAYEADPKRYSVALEYAENIQAGQPFLADTIFARALTDHPEKREATAERWYETLLARGDEPTIARLATSQVLADPPGASGWVRALVLSTRRARDAGALQRLADQPPAALWRPLLATEIAAQDSHQAPAIDPAEPLWPRPMPAYGVYYQLEALMENGHALEAVDRLETALPRLDAVARVSLRLKGLAEAGADQLREREIRALFDGQYSLAEVEIVCAHLIRYPSPGALQAVRRSLESRHPQITRESLGAWLALFCAEGTQPDLAALQEVGARLRNSGQAPGPAVGGLQSFFRGESSAHHLTSFLPFIPLPQEVVYALLDRPGRPGTP